MDGVNVHKYWPWQIAVMNLLTTTMANLLKMAAPWYFMADFWLSTMVFHRQHLLLYTYGSVIIEKISSPTLVRYRVSKELIYSDTPHLTSRFCRNELGQTLILIWYPSLPIGHGSPTVYIHAPSLRVKWTMNPILLNLVKIRAKSNINLNININYQPMNPSKQTHNFFNLSVILYHQVTHINLTN